MTYPVAPTVTRTVAVLASLAVLSCRASPSEPAASALRVTTDAGRYAARPDGSAAVGVVVENLGADSVALTGCATMPWLPATVVERRSGPTWQDAASAGLECDRSLAPFTTYLAPGGRLHYGVVVSAIGRYRLRVRVGPVLDEPAAEVRSAEFTVQ